jgi:hypothetical protein
VPTSPVSAGLHSARLSARCVWDARLNWATM